MTDELTGPCPNCGAVECKRWRMLNGMEVCDECWLDVAMDLQAMHWRAAHEALAASKRQVTGPHCPLPNRGQPVSQKQATYYPRRPATFPSRGPLVGKGIMGSRAQARPARENYLAQILRPAYNTVCMLCSHIFYGAALSSCSRCGGAVKLVSDHDLGLMGRHAQSQIESEA